MSTDRLAAVSLQQPGPPGSLDVMGFETIVTDEHEWKLPQARARAATSQGLPHKNEHLSRIIFSTMALRGSHSSLVAGNGRLSSRSIVQACSLRSIRVRKSSLVCQAATTDVQAAPAGRRALLAGVAGVLLLSLPGGPSRAEDAAQIEVVADEAGFGQHPVRQGDLVLMHYTGKGPDSSRTHETGTHFPLSPRRTHPATLRDRWCCAQGPCQMGRCLTPRRLTPCATVTAALACFGPLWFA
jgi:hypothetical protein